jgi:hypothetical protein
VPNELTQEEKKAIKRLRRAFDALPDTLIVYVVDDCACVCKRGVPSSEIDEDIATGLNPTNMLTDAHDDHGNGQSVRRTRRPVDF